MWRGLSEAQKGVWEDMADRVAEQHKLDHPNYEFTPRDKLEILRRGKGIKKQ